jgi:hypothetical protein
MSAENSSENSLGLITKELDKTNAKFQKLCEFKVNHWTKNCFWRKRKEPLFMKITTNKRIQNSIKAFQELKIRDIVENARITGLKIKRRKRIPFIPLFRSKELSISDSVSVPIVESFTKKNAYIYANGDLYISDESKISPKDQRIKSSTQPYRHYSSLEILVENLFLIGNNGCIQFKSCRLQIDGPILVYGYKPNKGFIPDYKSFITNDDRKITNDSHFISFLFILLEVGDQKFFVMIRGKFSI